MAHTYAVRTFDETGLVVRGGVAAAYEAAAASLATVVPADYRLIQLTEIGRNVGVDAVTVSFAALLEAV
jgi:hypothetical protein